VLESIHLGNFLHMLSHTDSAIVVGYGEFSGGSGGCAEVLRAEHFKTDVLRPWIMCFQAALCCNTAAQTYAI
jgi:hypothetical protein